MDTVHAVGTFGTEPFLVKDDRVYGPGVYDMKGGDVIALFALRALNVFKFIAVHNPCFTNNLSENAIRPFAVGRKNWLFSSSVDGANASAVVYTMVEMAKAHGLNIYGYLKFLLEHRPSKNMTDEQLAELAPWSEKLQSIKNRM